MRARIIQRRKDGKCKVEYKFEGGPNPFGGREFGKVINKIMTNEAIAEDREKNPAAWGMK